MSVTMTVRPAAMPDEADAVEALMLESVRWHGEQWPADIRSDGAPTESSSTPPLRDQLLEMAADPAVVILVAEVDGSVVGMLTGSVADKPTGGTLRYDGPLAFVADLAVDSAYRQRGIGGALLSSFESWARDRGAAHLRLFVHDGNTAAESLYERAGFRRVHLEMRKDF
jgi:ribosomal protein S18 acetylase RimI-like enzyme